MSFLNPVSEPVLRFSSTDAGAPQINYNSRVAGDVKAVLKACLVTGYGATASAGWSIVNEVAHIAEFVSPGATMSDYRLGIDDTSTSSTTWYYQYQDVRKNPAYNAPVKSFGNINNTHVANGWRMFVTNRGIVFIELVQHTVANKLSGRITKWGQVKSSLHADGENMCFFNIGHNAAIALAHYFYSSVSYVHVNLSSHEKSRISAATSHALSKPDCKLNASNIDLISNIYLTGASEDMLIGELTALLSKFVNNKSDIYGVSEQMIGGRNVLSVCAGYSSSTDANTYERSRTFLIPTDYWEY